MNAARWTVLAVGVVALQSAPAHAQRLEDRVADARGSVAFRFATKPYVCGDGRSVYVSNDTEPGWNIRRRSGMHLGTRDSDDPRDCEVAPARVVVEHDGKSVSSVRVRVGGPLVAADVELGSVSASDAVRYLLSVAPQLTGRSADQAIMGAAIADGSPVWQRLIDVARDNNASEASRKASVFWVSHEAGTAAAAALGSVAEDDEATLGVRSDALFYLAARKNGEGIDALIRVVKTSKSTKLRKEAVWYLGQTRDPRALALFAELLSGK